MNLLMRVLCGGLLWVIALNSNAHEDAQGVVKERMDSMSQMSNVMKVFSEFARGKREFENLFLIKQVGILKSHSGQNLISLFPEGTSGEPSEVREEIWVNWEDFTKFADELEESAESLTKLLNKENFGNSFSNGDTNTNKTSFNNNLDLNEFNEKFKAIGKVCSECHSKFRLKKLN